MKVRALVFVCALALALSTSSVAAGASQAPTYYVSLGDSLAAGTQPDPSGTNIPFTNEGYTDQLFAIERATLPTLQHVKLGCPGETTGSMRFGVLPYEGRASDALCRYPHGTQLAEAVSFLHAHRQFVAFVTIDIGANDFLGGHPEAIAANLPTILAALREAAGPTVPIVGMNYYDPLIVQWLLDHNNAALIANVQQVVTLNDGLEALYAAGTARVADVETAFMTMNTAIGPGGIPVDVGVICAWTWMCSLQNIHANATGYHMIALAFAAKL